MSFDSINIAENIKRFRQLKGYNRTELGKFLGVSGTMVSNYEKGLSSPPLKIIDTLCKTLDIGIEDLVYGDFQPTDVKPTTAREPQEKYKLRLEQLEARLAIVEKALKLNT